MNRELLDAWYVECKRHVHGVVRDLVEYCKLNEITSAYVIDVGSNVGLFVKGLSEHIEVKDAILIEPIDVLREYSKEFAPQYTYIRDPVSDTVQDVYIFVNLFGTNLGLSKMIPNNAEGSELYTSTTLSILSKQYNFNADIVKIDAEGHDIKCVEGYLDYLIESGHRPKSINFERSPDMDFHDVSVRFDALGYDTYHIGLLTGSGEIFFIPKWAKPIPNMIKYEKGA